MTAYFLKFYSNIKGEFSFFDVQFPGIVLVSIGAFFSGISWLASTFYNCKRSFEIGSDTLDSMKNSELVANVHIPDFNDDETTKLNSKV